jgi:hypothetical protein
MTSHPFAELIEEIAERERKAAVKDGDYLWALFCAFVERQARLTAATPMY